MNYTQLKNYLLYRYSHYAHPECPETKTKEPNIDMQPKVPYTEYKTVGKKKYVIEHFAKNKNVQTVTCEIDTAMPPQCTLIMPYLTYDGEKHSHHRFDIGPPRREMPSDKRSLIVLSESTPKSHLITIPPNKRCKNWKVQLKRWHKGDVYNNEIFDLAPGDTFTLNYTLW